MKINNAPKAVNSATEGIKNFNTMEKTNVIKDTKRIKPGDNGQTPVSYTHLTLPTILLV